MDGLDSKETLSSLKTDSDAEMRHLVDESESKQSGNVEKQQIPVKTESKPPKHSNFLFEYDSDCSWSKHYSISIISCLHLHGLFRLRTDPFVVQNRGEGRLRAGSRSAVFHARHSRGRG